MTLYAMNLCSARCSTCTKKVCLCPRWWSRLETQCSTVVHPECGWSISLNSMVTLVSKIWTSAWETGYLVEKLVVMSKWIICADTSLSNLGIVNNTKRERLAVSLSHATAGQLESYLLPGTSAAYWEEHLKMLWMPKRQQKMRVMVPFLTWWH